MPVDLRALKDRASLYDAVAEHVKLTKRGRDFIGICPFHREKTASLVVHVDYFNCFGCGAKGDVIDFTARINGVSKGRAIAMLAEQYGVETGPMPTRRESAYLRDLRAQAEFWWAWKRRAAVDALERACAALTDDPLGPEARRAIAAGRYLRLIDSIPPVIRGRAFVNLRTATDAAVWRDHLQELRDLRRIFGIPS